MPTPETRTPALTRVSRSRCARVTAATLAVGLAAGAVVAAGGGTADAASPVRAQSVGRFLDGSAGGMALQSLVDLKDARAKAAPNSSSRNPLDAKLFGQADIPIGDGLKLPGGGVFKLGAANQIAVAKTTGYSYGASGAVSNTGGAELTDESGSFPSDATINLSGAALGSTSIPGLPTSIPGLPAGASPSAATLGGVVGTIGAAQALAQTQAGGTIVTPQSSLADLELAIRSPALAALLSQLKALYKANIASALKSALANVPGASAVDLSSILPASCSLSTAPDPADLKLADGAVVLSAKNATIGIDVAKLIKQALGEDISHLGTSNFDLIKFLVRELPSILANGLPKLANSIVDPLETQFTNCSKGLSTIPGLGALAKPVIAALTSGFNTFQSTIESTITALSAPLIAGSGSGLTTLASGLTGVVDIGLNVQSGPKIQPHDTNYKYSTQLAKTPDQATDVVKGQSLVRAIEIDLLDASNAGSGLGGAGLPSLPSGLPGANAANSRQIAGVHQAAAAAGSSAVSIAIANAAAGPSTAAPAESTTTSTPGTDASSTNVPTGVPAGAAGHDDGGSPLLPVALVLLGLVAAGGGALALRTRGRFSR